MEHAAQDYQSVATPPAKPADVHDQHGEGRDGPRTVVITVNRHPVEVPRPKATGLQIKLAAIAAGLAIQIDFVLSLVRPNGDAEVIGDGDQITVNKNTTCVALAPDDNS